MVLIYLSHREKFVSRLFYVSVVFFLASSIYRLIPAARTGRRRERRTPLGSGWLTNARMEAAIKTDINFQTTNSTIKEEWEVSNQNIPNLPLIFATRIKGPKYNRSCALFPNFYAVQYSNVYWQVSRR